MSIPAIFFFAVLPTVVLSAVGIAIIAFSRNTWDVSAGILIINFTLIALIGGIIGLVLLYRARRQRALQTDFVAKVSHELRTPLASIRMFVDTLQEGGMGPEEQAACLAAISAENSRLTSMIERLLSWGRMESGRRVYDPRPERVDALVGEALAQLEVQIRETAIDVRLDLPDRVPAVNADRTAMVEALLNLMRNAITHGLSGGYLGVRVRNEGRLVLIDVEDRGPGIPKAEQRRIFERFYRGSAARSGAPRAGSGLGLAMVRHVVKAHGGKVLVVSREGEGARFTLSLKALPAEAATEVAPG